MMMNKKSFNHDPILNQLGHEDLFDFAERIVNGLSEGKYGESVIMDCGEGILVTANKSSTVDTIIRDFEKEFDEGFQKRYKKFITDIQRARAKNGYNG